MYTRDDLAEELSVRREELKRRAEDLREQFAEHVDEDAIAGFTAWTLISTGLAWGITRWARGGRRMMDLLLPIGLIAGGFAMLGGNSMWQRRTAHIGEAEARVRDELASLDPFARTRVLRDAARETVPLIRHINIRN